MKLDYRKTKNGKKRKGKTTATEQRLVFRQMFWIPLRNLLREHMKHTRLQDIADGIGTHPANIHQFLCPNCEHDREPCFSTGMALLMYLASYKIKVESIDASISPPRPYITDEEIIESLFEEIYSKPKKNYPRYNEN